MRPRPVQEGVGDERPGLRPAAERVQVAHRAGLIERIRVGTGANEEVDRPPGQTDTVRRPGTKAYCRISMS